MNLTWTLIITATVFRVLMVVCGLYSAYAEAHPAIGEIIGMWDIHSAAFISGVGALASFIAQEILTWWARHRRNKQIKTLETKLINVGVEP